MKKKILISTLVMIMALSVGCVNKSNAKDDTNKNTEESIEKFKSNEEMYEIYESHIEEVKSLSKEYGLELEDISETQTNYNNKTTSLYKYDETKDKEGDVIGAQYVAIIDQEGNIHQINAVLDMRVNNEGFKVEESKFNDFREIFTSEKIDYTKINEEINESIQRGVDEDIINQYDEIEEDILISGGIVSYRLRIYP